MPQSQLYMLGVTSSHTTEHFLGASGPMLLNLACSLALCASHAARSTAQSEAKKIGMLAWITLLTLLYYKNLGHGPAKKKIWASGSLSQDPRSAAR